jgi:hypothetical protein
LNLIFALEAILGDRSEGEKAESLAIRRATLAAKRTGSYVNPRRIYDLYAQPRSDAVHGEDPREVTRDELSRLSADVRQAIYEFLEYAAEHGITKRSQLVKELDSDPVRDEIKARFFPD